MTWARAFIRGRGGDALIVFLLIAAEIEVFTTLEGSRWAGALFAPLWTLPLLLRRRSGLVAGLTVAAVATVESFVDLRITESNILFVAILLAFVVIGLHEERARAVAAGFVGYVLMLALIANDSGGVHASDVFVVSIFVFGPLAAAIAVREGTHRATVLEEQAGQLERTREEAARVAVAEERARIARELHDVIAHSIGVMTVQAGAARTLLSDDTAGARASIEAVEATGREALAETRRLLGILRRDSGVGSTEPPSSGGSGFAATEADLREPRLTPQPGLALVGHLIDAVRRDGFVAELSVDGDPRPLAPGLDLAAYRIVQEGLVQARRRDGVTRTQVRLRWRPDALEIAIDDDGPVETVDDVEAPIQLAVMRERIALYGGTIETACGHDGCRSVRARLPLEASA